MCSVADIRRQRCKASGVRDCGQRVDCVGYNCVGRYVKSPSAGGSMSSALQSSAGPPPSAMAGQRMLGPGKVGAEDSGQWTLSSRG